MRYGRTLYVGLLIVGLLAVIVLGFVDFRLYVIVHSVRRDFLG